MEKIDNNIQLAFLGGMKAGLEALIHGLEVVAENNNGQVSFEFVKMVSASTIADVELKLSSMENGKGLIDVLNNKSEWNEDLLWRMENIMNNGIYHIQDNKIYKMSLDEPMKKIGVIASDEAIMNIIDTVTEYMYCNWGDCCMKEITWDELQKVRNEIKDNAMDMIKANLDIKW